MDICKVIAHRSTCVKLKTATLIVRNNNIISIGYNGTAPNAPHCSEYWAEEGYVPKDPLFRAKHREWSAKHEIHAEINAIVKGPRDLSEATLYTLYSPCIHCAKCIVAAGIKRVVYSEEYARDFFDTSSLFLSLDVQFEKNAC